MRVMIALVVATLTWLMLMFATTSSEITQPKNNNGETITFEVKLDKNGYTKLISDLREKLKDPQQAYCGIPVLRNFDSKEYIYVKLISKTRNSITLAIRKSSIYVLGYSYEYDEKLCARFFTDTGKQEWKKIFGDGIANGGKENIGCSSAYREIEGKAGLGGEGRKSLPLGMTTLGSHIDKISKIACTTGYPTNFAKTEAEFLLIAIQMVSEATRFKYIEEKIKDNISKDFNPDNKMIEFEKKWDVISEAILNAKHMGLLNSPKAQKWLMMQLDDNVTEWDQ